MPVAQPADIEERIADMGGALPSVRRQNWADLLGLAFVVVLGTAAIVGTLLHVPSIAVQAAVLGLVAVSFAGVYQRMMSRPDHVRALQSDSMLNIATESLPFLRQGLEEQTAGEVCRIVLRTTEAAAVAITDTDRVLGFAGVGEEHHLVGGPIITRATHEALELDAPQVLQTKEEIGCPEPACRLRSAIVVPLEKRGEPVGTLKFYYTSDRYLNENQLAMAEGLARLLSTQLELSELERQTELATQMELKALQAQINPHFLFNTINTIAAFIRTDPTEARRLLRQFGTFYRRTLEEAEDLITLDRELEFVDTYVQLEKARFGDRLEFVQDVAGRGTLVRAAGVHDPAPGGERGRSRHAARGRHPPRHGERACGRRCSHGDRRRRRRGHLGRAASRRLRAGLRHRPWHRAAQHPRPAHRLLRPR